MTIYRSSCIVVTQLPRACEKASDFETFAVGVPPQKGTKKKKLVGLKDLSTLTDVEGF